MTYATMRVQVSTLASLRRYRNALQVSVDRDHARFARFAPSFKVSLDDAVGYLIDQQGYHAKRGAKKPMPGERAKDAHCDDERERMASRDNGRVPDDSREI